MNEANDGESIASTEASEPVVLNESSESDGSSMQIETSTEEAEPVTASADVVEEISTEEQATPGIAVITPETNEEWYTNIIEGTQNARVKTYTGTAASVTVLATVPIGGQNYAVTEEEAFMGKTSLQSVELPNSITAIRARAFKDCTSLSTMTSY